MLTTIPEVHDGLGNSLAGYASCPNLIKPWLELPFRLHLCLSLMTLYAEALGQGSGVGEIRATLASRLTSMVSHLTPAEPPDAGMIVL